MKWKTLTATLILLALALPASGQRIMSQANDKAYRAILPDVDSPALQGIFKDPDTMFYTEQEMPLAYQDFEGALNGVHSPLNNISAVPTEPHGNANREFPWKDPFGTHLSPNVKSYRFLHLPKSGNGIRWPVIWWVDSPKPIPGFGGPSGAGYAWLFPKGAVLGEVLYLTDSKGLAHVFEVRTRTREINRWKPNVFRPFTTAAAMAQGIKLLWPNYRKKAKVAYMVEWLEMPPTDKPLIKVLFDVQPNKKVITQHRWQDVLPAIDEADVVHLLNNTEFKSAVGKTWRDGHLAPHAPTTKAPFHIVPKDYTAGFIAVDTESCMQCHNTCNHHARTFDFARDWYGRVRGSDGIFSFHPFNHASISYAGNPNGIAMNSTLTSLGIIDRYNSQYHPGSIYQRIPSLN